MRHKSPAGETSDTRIGKNKTQTTTERSLGTTKSTFDVAATKLNQASQFRTDDNERTAH